MENTKSYYDEAARLFEEAHEMLDKNKPVYTLIAARKSLEAFVRGLCVQHDMEAWDESGHFNSLDTLITQLVDAGYINGETEEKVKTIRINGNRAAHSSNGSYVISSTQARRILQQLEDVLNSLAPSGVRIIKANQSGGVGNSQKVVSNERSNQEEIARLKADRDRLLAQQTNTKLKKRSNVVFWLAVVVLVGMFAIMLRNHQDHNSNSFWGNTTVPTVPLETNNTPATADEISANEEYRESIIDGDDTDWYKVTLADDGFITLQFEHELLSSNDTYWYVYLYFTDGDSVDTDYFDYWPISGSANKTTAQIGLPAGTYYIAVEPYASYQYDSSVYTLRINHTASEVWETEMNDYSSTADPITANVDYYGRCHDGDDCDWFVVAVPENGYITLQFDHKVLTDNDTYWHMYLYREDGTEISYWSISGAENKETNQYGLPAGTYYIAVEPYASYQYDSSVYTLRINHTASEVWETEMNDYSSTADPITANVDYYGRCHDGDDCDWFVVTVPENGYITLQFDHEVLTDDDAYWYMYLYFTDGSSASADYFDYWSISGSSNKTTEPIGLPKGTYYIRIEPYSYSRYDTSAYTLCVNHTVSDAWETENNDLASVADEININTDYYGVCGDDQGDWYVFTLSEDGRITLQFDHELFADSDEYWCMTLCDEGGGEIGCWSISGSENTKTEQIALSAGTYYIKIEPYASYRYDMSRYILCVDFTTVP